MEVVRSLCSGDFLKPYLTILDIAQNSRFPWVWVYASTAIVMAIAVGVFMWLASESRREAGLGRTANAPPQSTRKIPAERIELLARFDPPPYEPAAEDSRQFRMAMQRYQQRDYAGAILLLRVAADAQPESAGSRFYLAICELLTNDRTSGVAELRNVIADGNTPYLERARFYLAKGLLASGDIRGADTQLRIVVEMHEALEKQAQVMLAQILPAR